MEETSVKISLDNWNDEMNSAEIYRSLAEMEKDPKLSEVYRRMAAVEEKHAEKWVTSMNEAGGEVPVFSPAFRTGLMIWLAKRFGPSLILPGVQAMEQKGTEGYRALSNTGEMAGEERGHARIIRQITGSMAGMEGGALAQLEGRHRASGGNALRAAVLGANDGLVSNLSLVMGVAGASLSNQSILITGLAGLLAGASSMALGEWLSVQSSRELYENQIGIEKAEIASSPEEETEELALIYESRGLNQKQAKMLAGQIMSKPETAVATLAREELSINPEELGGSPWVAAITSFTLFALGAVVPVLPFILFTGATSVYVSIGLATLGLFTIGAMTSLFTGKPMLFSGMRMVVFGLIAAGITFGIGRLIGVSIG